MRVLITGGYGFIGSFVAERFHKEGYEVSIMDNLSTGNKDNVPFKHKSYLLSVEDRNCEEIFRSNRFDLVIHLAAQVNAMNSMENPRQDTQSNVLGLSNMLSLSQKFNVKKFIFASSSAVYGVLHQKGITEETPLNPVTPYGINKMIGETYCSKWNEMYDLETICFRLSNVYGPRQHQVLEDSSTLFTGKSTHLIENDNILHDFIYVEDVAEAFYRASYSSLTGIFNLSSNTANEAKELIRILGGTVSGTFRGFRPKDLKQATLDNTKLIQQLDWIPKYSFEEGVRKTQDWFMHHNSKLKKETKKADSAPSPFYRIMKVLLPYIENFAAFFITVWLTFSLDGYLLNHIDFKLFYIIIMGIFYGSRQSIIAVALSTFFYMYLQLDRGRELLSLFYDPDFFFNAAVYIFIGLVVGYSTERKLYNVVSIKQQLIAWEEKYKFLLEVYNDTRAVKDELQQQIMNNGDSFGKIYSVIKELESLEPEKIFTSTISVVESIMKTNTVTIYTVNKYKSYLRLVARSNSHMEVSKSIKVEDYPYLRQIMEVKSPFVNKELSGELPLLAAPVLSNGEVVAIISIHDMKFEHFTLYYQNLFKVMVDLISSALTRSLIHVEATSNRRYIEGTNVLTPEVFADILVNKKTASSKHGISYVLLSTVEAMDASHEYSQKIAKSLRETDYIGMGPNGDIQVLLSNSSLDEAQFVLDRFRSNGILLKVINEDANYA
ncbi:NAD-dependent epimerase/dehydratase family protein [Paenibacillus silviterrae]|uniref:NAD-dependent epimerase/dehydratase family protein n=1 Tax=Paenibacillus silviterrae TaxID=3242194 RepID=UPI0025433FB0|nr:NAD-dependent epimerase/dehydratase family protein [Paenibacillus chinjuensis]